MARLTPMQRLARWHIWLGWIVGLPLLIWTVTGLFMVARPIEEVRGNHLRAEPAEEVLPAGAVVLPRLDRPVLSLTITSEQGEPVTRAAFADGSMARFDRSGAALPLIDESAARKMVAAQVRGGDRVAAVTLFGADRVPFDFRRPMPVWQLVLQDGTHVYVGQQSGRIEAVRTRWWRVFDFMWGLHILDPQTREDTSHPLLIAAAALSLVGVMFGAILLFRRRRRARA